jgi:hypothetical protein
VNAGTLPRLPVNSELNYMLSVNIHASVLEHFIL